ncbi:MAG TPA: DNA-3-methyladenine glycosylase I, partial [Fluviicoccus sp.]|nr:DNA-3-methyladenine glycosylase I [Fluviicoccus sp.]
FDGFDYRRVATYTESDVQRLLQDAGIVRHRGKIEAVINNAQRMIELVEQEGSLSAFVQRFKPADDGSAPVVRPTCPESEALSKALKKRGWKFVGPTTVYAFMQAMGLVNDHAIDCVIRKAC